MTKLNLKFSGIYKDLALILLAAVCGGLAGGFAGYFAASSEIQVRPPATVATGTSSGLKVLAPTSTFSLVQVERPVLASIVPPAFLQRRASAVGTLYRAPKSSAAIDDRLLTDDRMLGQVVAMTSDGWFITTASAIGASKAADLVIWYGGAAYPVASGVIDHLNGTVYLKTTAKDVPAASFSAPKTCNPAPRPGPNPVQANWRRSSSLTSAGAPTSTKSPRAKSRCAASA